MTDETGSAGLPPEPVFYTLYEACDRLRISRRSLTRLIKRHQVELSFVGGTMRKVIHRDELARLIRHQRNS